MPRMILMSRKQIRWAAVATFIGAAIYVGSYLVLTLRGDYQFTQSGEFHYTTGLSVTDMLVWSPKDLWWQGGFKTITGDYTSRGDTAGYLVLLQMKMENSQGALKDVPANINYATQGQPKHRRPRSAALQP